MNTNTGKRGVWRLTVRLDFSAAHQLENYGGKCERLHGHNFGVEVSVIGTELDEKVEYLIDFKELKGLVKEVLESLDHRVLNETAAFAQRNPSSENIARHVYQEVGRRLPPRVRMDAVSISEKDSSVATYYEED